MKKQILLLALVLMLACSLTAAASDIYKSVDADGVVVFSDRPSSDAEKIEVQPNVIQTAPVNMPEPVVSSDGNNSTQSPARQQSNVDIEDNRTTTRRERAERAANEEENKRESELEVDPDPGRANRNAVRRAAGPR